MEHTEKSQSNKGTEWVVPGSFEVEIVATDVILPYSKSYREISAEIATSIERTIKSLLGSKSSIAVRHSTELGTIDLYSTGVFQQ